MSKMQMLLFAVGIAVVALLFYDFVSRIGLAESANNLIITNTKLISDQMSIDVLCSFDDTVIPDRLGYGLNSSPFYYDLEFSKSVFGPEENTQNLLSLRVVEHSTKPERQKNYISAKSFTTDAKIMLIDPGFIKETIALDTFYDEDFISLYPRAAKKSELTSAPNAFVALKEVKGGEKYLYIIPCATEKEPNNCKRNILRVGCHKLKERQKEFSDVTDSTQLDSCFNITVQVDAYALGDYTTGKSTNFTWGDCKKLFPEVI